MNKKGIEITSTKSITTIVLILAAVILFILFIATLKGKFAFFTP